MKEIILTQGYVALVDDDDYELANSFKWHVWGSSNLYAAHTLSTKQTLLLHRFLLGAPEGTPVDHIDGNGLNCQRCNLRLATPSQNLQNRGRQSNNRSGYKGVYWHVGNKMWKSEITVNKMRIHLGYFHDLEAAARAYREASKLHHGEFSKY